MTADRAAEDVAALRPLVHQFAAPFTALCGFQGAHRAHGDRGKVTCPDCLALPDDPGARADYDQLVATMREATR